MVAGRDVYAGRVNWNDWLPESFVRTLDAVVGLAPEPRWAVSEVQQPFPVGRLAVRGALWGAALGALAPVTTALVVLTGLEADDVSLTDTGDRAFLLGFMPLVVGLVAVLLSWNHWPLRDRVSYHRELSVALSAVGVVLLVELRAHGATVTSDEYDASWPLANGSLLLHILVTYLLVRVAAVDIGQVHARAAGWSGRRAAAVEPLPAFERLATEPSRAAATMALALRGIMWGAAIGAGAGAAAGTLVSPVLGTLGGAYLGAVYGLVPAVGGAVAVVTVVSWRRDTDPAAIYRAVHLTIYAVGAAALGAAWPFLHSVPFRPAGWQDANLLRIWLILLVTVVLMLRQCAPGLADAYIRRVPRAIGPGDAS